MFGVFFETAEDLGLSTRDSNTQDVKEMREHSKWPGYIEKGLVAYPQGCLRHHPKAEQPSHCSRCVLTGARAAVSQKLHFAD